MCRSGRSAHLRTEPGQRILIVDDEESVRYVFSSRLRRLGYDCTPVSSGREALEALENQDFDVVLLDVKMPGMSGLEVLRTLRPEHPLTCVVMLSALVDAEIASAALSMGADTYLTKPCSREYLRDRLQMARKHRARIIREGSESATGSSGLSLREITEDLIQQQMALYERLLHPPNNDDSPYT